MRRATVVFGRLDRIRMQTASTSRQYSSPAIRPDLNFDYLLDEENTEKIRQNIRERKGVGDIDACHRKWKKVESIISQETKGLSEEEYKKIWDELYDEALLIPNTSHPNSPRGGESNNEVVCEWGAKREGDALATAEKIAHSWRGILHPTDACGQRSYAFLGPLADLEKALLDSVYEAVLQKGFRPVVVPDLVNRAVTRACGVIQRENQHNIQYFLNDEPDVALSGTAEMGISAFLQGRTFNQSHLPRRLVSQSRCYRPEISSSASEARLYRVHEFTKVEMFVVCLPEQSEQELQKIVSIQKEIFQDLGAHAKLLNMATEELGPAAHQKYDIEAWMPGRNVYGEVSSASNCTDFQARRLNIRYVDDDGEVKHVHTCNGTAMASTRALITLLETYQNERRGMGDLPSFIKDRLPVKRTKPVRFRTAAPLS